MHPLLNSSNTKPTGLQKIKRVPLANSLAMENTLLCIGLPEVYVNAGSGAASSTKSSGDHGGASEDLPGIVNLLRVGQFRVIV